MSGNAAAGEEVLAKTYEELRRIARARLRHERRDHTLTPTAVLHEAYLRLMRRGPGPVANREAFFRLVAGEIRRRLVDHAQRRLANKRGGGAVHEPLSSIIAASSGSPPETESVLERLDRALAEFAVAFPRAAQVVELQFLSGLTTDETARHLGISPGTVKREWTFARAWLAAAIGTD